MRLGDFHLPDGWQVNAEDPTWKAGKEFAHKNGLSQDQFAGIARLYIQAQIDAHSRDETVLTAQLKARDEALGANGAARVDALNTWLKAVAEPRVADQLSKTLLVPLAVFLRRAAGQPGRPDLGQRGGLALRAHEPHRPARRGGNCRRHDERYQPFEAGGQCGDLDERAPGGRDRSPLTGRLVDDHV